MNEDRHYLQYFTLTAKPFYDLKDPRFVWLGENQLETLARLKNGVEQRKGIALLTGVAGAGKSVLVDQFMRSLPKGTITVLLREPGLKVERYRQLIAEQLALPQAETKGDFLSVLKDVLDSAYRHGRYVVVVAEDLDRAEDEVLEQVRLVSNLETPDQEKLIHILITGNRLLEERLATYEHRALQQRVEVRRTVEALSITETAGYIRHRMMVAGAFLEVFTAEAVERIHRFSQGLPKPIDIICDHALRRACSGRSRKVDGAMIDIYLREIRASSRIGLDLTGDESRSKYKLNILRTLTAGIVLLLVASLYLPKGELKPLPEQTIAQVTPPAFSLQFEPRSAAIPPVAFQRLDAAAEFVRLNRQSRILLKSNISSKRLSDAEKHLVLERVSSVRNYLVRNGVDLSKIETVQVAAPLASAKEIRSFQNTMQIDLEITASTN